MPRILGCRGLVRIGTPAGPGQSALPALCAGGGVAGVVGAGELGVAGDREILGLQVFSAEDGAGWRSFFWDLTARGLSGSRW